METTEKKYHRFTSEEVKAMWADPVKSAQLRAAMSRGAKRKWARKKARKKAAEAANRIRSRRRIVLSKIRWLPGANKLVKWIVR